MTAWGEEGGGPGEGGRGRREEIYRGREGGREGEGVYII